MNYLEIHSISSVQEKILSIVLWQSRQLYGLILWRDDGHPLDKKWEFLFLFEVFI